VALGLTSATIVYTYALKYGKAANCSGIENTKVMIQTALVMVFQGVVPQRLEIIGMLAGIIGTIMIALNQKE